MAIITIGGNVGAGKTTLAGKLAGTLDYQELYMGGIFREMAAERGMTIEAFYAVLGNDPHLERSADERQKVLMHAQDNLVVQGRIAWHFAQGSPYKVANIFLGVDSATGARRTAERKENAGRDLQELARANRLREQEEFVHYQALYDIQNFLDPAHYDFILETSHLNESQVLQKILDWLKAEKII